MPKQDETVTIWWIDDDHMDSSGPRAGELQALARQAGAGLHLVPIHPADFEQHAFKLANEELPDLLLIDFRLGMQRHAEKETPFFAQDGVRLRGVALGIEELLDVPAYLVSRVIKKWQIGSMDDHFDWVLSHGQLTRTLGGAFLLADATDYRRLRAALAGAAMGDPKVLDRRLAQAVLDLLDIPAASVEPLEPLVLHAVSTVLRNESALDSDELKLAPNRPRAIARWVRSALQRVRGPLVDELQAATMLGTTVGYFDTTLRPQLELDQAQYTGIFQTTAVMTLWRQALLERLLLAIEAIELSPPASLARAVVAHFDVPDEQLAVCRVCGGPWPEAVGFDEEDRTVQAPVHWRCSWEASDVDTPFGFDVVRSFNS